MAVLLSVPGTVVLAVIVHDLPPAQRDKVLKLSRIAIVPRSIPSVKTDHSRLSEVRIIRHTPSYDFCTLLEAEMSTAFTEAKAVAKAKIAAVVA